MKINVRIQPTVVKRNIILMVTNKEVHAKWLQYYNRKKNRCK